MFYPSHNVNKAILHIDADCFFAACEIAVNPKLQGKPVVTGKERGIVSSMTYDVKARGVKRGMVLSEVRKLVPDVIILPSDYETYSLFSKRMFEIVRRYTPEVEEYSIDECFADITGLRRTLNMSYPDIAKAIKHTLKGELGMDFSIGLGPSKVVAKIGSKWDKPDGLVCIKGRDLEKYLTKLPLDKIWGIGGQTKAYLNKLNIYTAHDFAQRDEEWIKDKVSKPYYEIWHELNGRSVMPVIKGLKESYQSISKTKTFTPASDSPAFVYAQLSKNVESACIKVRRYKLEAQSVVFFLKTQDFRYKGLEFKLDSPTDNPSQIMRLIGYNFNKIFQYKNKYRATGVILGRLNATRSRQLDLFGEQVHSAVLERVFESVDALSEKYGKHTVFLGSSFQAMTKPQHGGDRGKAGGRKANLMKGESARRHIGIPILGDIV